MTALTQDGYARASSAASPSPPTAWSWRASNGQNKPAGQVELAAFRNPQGLQAQGGNVWIAQHLASGEAIGRAG